MDSFLSTTEKYIQVGRNFLKKIDIKLNFTNRQEEFIKSLLYQLNFNQIEESYVDKFNAQYFIGLLKSYQNYKSLTNCEYSTIIHNGVEIKIPKNALLSFKYKDNGNFFEVVNFSIFNYLIFEIKVKENALYDIVDQKSKYISASDIANFTYCPVSYAISKSIKYKTLISAKLGTELHESSYINSIIFNEFKKEEFVSTNEELFDDENFKILNAKLKNCDILYSGHSGNEEIKYFKSSIGSFIGQPDFILRDRITKKIFVIEEKYHNIPKQFYSYGDNEYYNQLEKDIKSKREIQLGYDNHINQLLSYIYGIADYEIDYGMLIYWKYEIDENKKTVTKCNFRTIHRNEEYREKLNKIYKKIRNFVKNESIEFNIKSRNPSRCANCVNNILCGHKTGKYSEISLPYNSKYLKINKKKYPDSLEKDKISYVDKLLNNIVIDDNDDILA